MNIPLHTQIRRKLRKLLYNGLSFLMAKKETQHSIDKNEIKSIIIIRPNYRIGNIIFLTPLINALNEELPHAKVDILVGMKLAGDTLKDMPNIENVYSIPRELLKKPWRLYSFIKSIRQKQYDLALNITAGSVSSELATLLINAKYKASFQHEKTFIPLTHTVHQERKYIHAGSRPLELLKLFNVTLPENEVPLDIKLTQSEKNQGKKELRNLLEKHHKKHTFVISLFRNARFDKKIEDKWWNEWYKELLNIDSSIVVIDILSPDIPNKLNDTMLEYGNKNLRKLGAFFHACNLYISADTGPLHLATSSNAKAIALFNKTNPSIFGTIGNKHLTLDVTQYTPKEIATITYKQLKEES